MTQARHSFTLKATQIVNTLVTPCWVSAAWQPGDSAPEPERVQFDGLWDTGATASMITERIVEKLGLTGEGLTKIHHATGESDNVPLYYVNLVLLNNVRITGVRASLGKLPGIDVLIGMDIINRGDFAVSNCNGSTQFSFRIPSVKNFDFVKIDDKYNRKSTKSGKRRGSKRRRGKR